MTERDETLVCFPVLMRVLIPSWGPTHMTSSKPNHLLKAPLPNIITLGVRAPTYEFWGDTNIRSITIIYLHYVLEVKLRLDSLDPLVILLERGGMGTSCF